MVLPHHLGEIARAVFAGEHEVRHRLILKGYHSALQHRRYPRLYNSR
jgi:hypothetical protein